MKVLISGGTGLLGTTLIQKLVSRGHSVHVLTRTPKKQSSATTIQFGWNPAKQEIDEQCFNNVDAIIHLAGAGIADKAWTKSRKEEIINSRVNSAQLLYNTMQKVGIKIPIFISASGVGYYGAVTTSTTFTEEHPPNHDFLAECCIAWEKAADLFLTENSRVVKLRISAVLAKDSGALPKIAEPIKYFAGAALGSGRQIMPWVHIHDVCNAFVWALENESINGAFNVCSDEQPTNAAFTKELAEAMRKPLFLPNVPGFVLKLALGELANMVLEGSFISNKKIKDAGFHFQFNNLKQALVDLI
jgi:uncharacterized protein (TIGR01777 family)